MQFDFDPGKDATNLSKHGLSIAAAAELGWDAALVWIDHRADYGEVRMVALAPIGAILCFVAFVDRVPVRRVIGLRSANRREVSHYVKAFK
ncbi:BrnT family toxin [Cyanobium sp. AMD-g]|uniref:BrnT family toxin n=1 Tax=Cyanobium sp. AMD-g TaxID=2823699 RepID=UPI0020CC3958|nr:BrnT family toxin [Cyanobium sp. AMD-g]MCP9930493.1 BrnT family toxin [Cyanobium sp. AMD-g]